MLKKKFLSLSLMFLLVLFLGLFSTSYTMAYSWDELLDFATQVSNDSNASVRQRSLAGSVLLHKDGWTNYITQKVGNLNNIKGIWVFYNGGSSASSADRTYIYIWTYVPSLDFSSSGGSGMSPSSNNRANYGLQYINNGFDTIGSVGESMQRDKGFGLVETSNTSTIYSGWYLQNKYIPTPQSYFTPNHDHIVTKNNINYNTLLRSFSVNQWEIGETTNFNDLDAFQFYFYDLVANVELGYVEGYREAGILRGKNCLYFSPPNMYVNSRYIRYDNPYRLDIHKFLDSVETIETHYFLFLPRNATVSNGAIINYGSGDFNVQDSTNAIIEAQQSGDSSIIGVIESGNQAIINSLNNTTLESGDQPTLEDLPSITIPDKDDPSHEFFSWLMLNITDILEDENEQTLVIPIYKTNYEIRSDVFKLDIEPLKTFIQAGWWFIVGVPFLKYVRRCIEKIKGGEIPASDDKSDLLGNVL